MWFGVFNGMRRYSMADIPDTLRNTIKSAKRIKEFKIMIEMEHVGYSTLGKIRFGMSGYAGSSAPSTFVGYRGTSYTYSVPMWKSGKLWTKMPLSWTTEIAADRLRSVTLGEGANTGSDYGYAKPWMRFFLRYEK